MFKKIKDYDYEISDKGEVKNIKTGRILKPDILKYGHLQVILYKNGNCKQ